MKGSGGVEGVEGWRQSNKSAVSRGQMTLRLNCRKIIHYKHVYCISRFTNMLLNKEVNLQNGKYQFLSLFPVNCVYHVFYLMLVIKQKQ